MVTDTFLLQVKLETAEAVKNKHITLETQELRMLLEKIILLRENLEEIRDLARTGLKPNVYPTEMDWLRHKCNRIASIAQAALE